MTLSGALIRRYYLLAVFPLELVWFARLALRGARGRAWLGALWGAQLAMSACFVYYVHVNQGSTQGDYGDAYHLIMKKRKGP
jgi:4-amino-4-deoxy-L-arabinose transferase-like glycosyltransferase